MIFQWKEMALVGLGYLGWQRVIHPVIEKRTKQFQSQDHNSNFIEKVTKNYIGNLHCLGMLTFLGLYLLSSLGDWPLKSLVFLFSGGYLIHSSVLECQTKNILLKTVPDNYKVSSYVTITNKKWKSMIETLNIVLYNTNLKLFQNYISLLYYFLVFPFGPSDEHVLLSSSFYLFLTEIANWSYYVTNDYQRSSRPFNVPLMVQYYSNVYVRGFLFSVRLLASFFNLLMKATLFQVVMYVLEVINHGIGMLWCTHLYKEVQHFINFQDHREPYKFIRMLFYEYQPETNPLKNLTNEENKVLPENLNILKNTDGKTD